MIIAGIASAIFVWTKIGIQTIAGIHFVYPSVGIPFIIRKLFFFLLTS